MPFTTIAASGLIPAKFCDMEAHFATSITANWGPLKRTRMAEGVAHHRSAYFQYCAGQCSTGKHSDCGRGNPLGPAVLAVSPWCPAVESLHSYVMQVVRFEAPPAIAIAMEQVPGNLIRCERLWHSLQYKSAARAPGRVRHLPGPSSETWQRDDPVLLQALPRRCRKLYSILALHRPSD